jgi:FAD:protein FMN transferase
VRREAEIVIGQQLAGTAVDDAAPETIAFATRALGSTIRLTVHCAVGNPGAQGSARRAWDAVELELDAVDRCLSRFRDDSELTILNRQAGTGAIVPVSRRLRGALALVDRARRETGNRFDASVLDVLERIGEHGADLAPEAGSPPAIPGGARTNGAIEPLEAGRTGRTGTTGGSLAHVPPVPLDMGGVGKGLALRWAAAAALAELPDDGGLLLEAGGDLVAAGCPPDGGWRIGIEDAVSDPAAHADEQPLVVVAMDMGAVATSSIRVRNWRGPDGRQVHHLVDPSTREPARTGLLAVTVARTDPAWAEIWSKALFVAGRDAIADEARARGLAAWWVDDRGRLGMTPDARIRTLWAAEHRLG